MKVAVLPGNQHLHFPDETPDEVMQMAVQNHLAPPPEIEPPMPDVLSAAHMIGQLLTQVIPQAAHSLLDQQAQNHESTEELKVQEIVGNREAARRIEAALTALVGATEKPDLVVTAKHIVQILAGINQGITGINQGLEFNAKNSAQLTNVVKAINNLSNTLTDSTKAILSSLALRRQLFRLPDGTPDAIQQIPLRRN